VPADQIFRLSISLSFNGVYLGDVNVETTIGGQAKVDSTRVIELLRPLVTPELLTSISGNAHGEAMVPIADLNLPGFELRYDSSALTLVATTASAGLAINAISVIPQSQRTLDSLTDPSNTAFGVTVSVNQRLAYERDFDRGPAEVVVRGFGNVGGLDGVYLAFEGGYREHQALVRRRVSLFYDDVSTAVRFSLGDAVPQTMGSYEANTNMFGFTVERLYQTIQPFRNVRPSGRGGLTLDKASRVDVVVNGAVQQTLRLGPGRYDLRDFPGITGYNDVQLVVEDETGRREFGTLSFFSDTQLLDQGISIFSASLGFLQRSGGLFDTPEYDHHPTLAGFYQRGMSKSLTLGVAAQADPDNALVAVQAAYATPVGIFGLELAADGEKGRSVERAVLASWRLFDTSGTTQATYEVEFESLSKGFSPLAPAGTAVNPYKWEVDGRIQRQIAYGVFGTIGAGFSRARGAMRDERRATVALTRSFQRLSVGFNYDHRRGGFGGEDRFSLSLNIPLGRRTTARARYNSRDNLTTAEVTRNAYNGLDEYGYRVAMGHDDEGPVGSAEAEYFANRFSARMNYDYIRTPAGSSQDANIGFTFGVGYTDGRLALGREADQGFVIVDQHRTMGDAKVYARNKSTLGDSAHTGALGPALVPIVRGYSYDTVEVHVENLRPGYDIGPGRIDILPGARSGYLMQIGSDASNTVMGRIVGPDGQPASLLAGTLKPVDGAGTNEVSFFTNRTGRLVAQRVAPGRYAIVPFGRTTPIGEILVPKDAAGTVDIGTLTYQDAKP